MNDPIQNQSATVQLSKIDIEVIKVLLYFDLFLYPLKGNEIYKNLSTSTDKQQCDESLDYLRKEMLLEFTDGYYHLEGQAHYVQRRIKGGELAEKFMPKAVKISRFISKRAFVKGVLISGSLSKGYMEKGSDIDYFIITAPNRVWFVKGWLALIKKVFLLNSKKYFCLNYFIDTEHLHIQDHNEFTAKEINYLIPTFGQEYYAKFLEANRWSSELCPNFNAIQIHKEILNGDSKWKRFKEKLWSGKFGDWLDTRSMKLFESFWKRKYKKKFKVNEGIQIKCQKHVSKIHPGNYQDRVLNSLAEKKAEFEEKYKVKLSI